MEFTRNDHPATLLLAGFGPFPGAPLNPAERLVRGFDAASLGTAVRLARLVLPVEWDRSWQVLEAEIGRLRPDAVLLVGLHAGADRFRIEMTARNERDVGRADAAGRTVDAPAIAPGPDALRPRLPVEALSRSLRAAEIDFEFSEDAGRYLCNETLFRLCLHGAALGLRYFGFLHTPLTDECAAEARRDEASRAESGRTVPAVTLDLMVAGMLGCLSDAMRVGDAEPDAGRSTEAAQPG